MTAEPYAKAPITEAIIDLQIRRVPQLGLVQLKELADKLKEEYPIKMDITVTKGAVQLGRPLSSASTTQEQMGFLLTDKAKNCNLQIRVDGFSFSMLAPYTQWSDFSKRARALWEQYCLSTVTLSRMAIRYVNRINLPMPIRDFRDYLRTYPELSSDMEPYLSGYFMQLQCPQPSIEALAIVTQGMVPSTSPNVISILLDIDLARAENLPDSDDQLWDLMDRFRVSKNEIFEACITNRTRRLFE